MISSAAPGLRAAGATAAAVAATMGFRRRRRRVEETGTGEGETIETGGCGELCGYRAHAKRACLYLLCGHAIGTCGCMVLFGAGKGVGCARLRWCRPPCSSCYVSAEQWDGTLKHGTWSAFEREVCTLSSGMQTDAVGVGMSYLTSCPRPQVAFLRGRGENMADKWINRPTVRVGDHNAARVAAIILVACTLAYRTVLFPVRLSRQQLRCSY